MENTKETLNDIKKTLKNSNDINQAWYDLLEKYCLEENIDSLKYLLETNPSDFDTNFAKDYILLMSIQNNKLNLFKYSQSICNIEEKMIKIIVNIVQFNNMDFIKYLDEEKFLVQKNSNRPMLNFETALKQSASKGKIEIFKYLYNQTLPTLLKGVFELRAAAGNGHLDIVKFLVEDNVVIENEILIYSAENGHINVVEYLIKNKIDVNMEKGLVLIKSISQGHTNVVKLLLANGADINLNSQKIIKKAIDQKNLEIIMLLVEYGADLEKVVNKGYNIPVEIKEDIERWMVAKKTSKILTKELNKTNNKKSIKVKL